MITAPAATVPDIVARRRQGRAGAIIISAGLGHGAGSLAEACAASARANGLRLVGPNCIGLLSPPAKLNASFTTCMPGEGDLALVSQSGAITAGLVEWSGGARRRLLGIVSLGDRIDVDFGDLLDHFALDRRTRAILHVHRIHQHCAQVHVGGAGRGAGETRAGGQVRTAGARRQGGAHPHRGAGRLGRGL